MGTAKRERQKAGRQARIEQAKAAQARKRRTRFAIWGVVLVGVIVLALFLLAPDDDGDDVATGSTTSSSTTSSSVEGSPVTVQITVPAPGETLTGETPCPAADGSSPRTTTFAGPPPMCIDPDKSYTAEVLTSEGIFSVDLDPSAAPETVNNFVVLSRYHFYDGVAFHRIIPGFMNQTGDAVGPTPGTGSPGYSIPDELPTGDAPYPEGSLAMANTGQPDTGGSQWFVTVADGGSQLTPSYSRFGSVSSGIEVVRQINNYGDPATGQAGTPTQEVVIESITITET